MIPKINKELLILVAGRIVQIAIMLISIKITTTLFSPMEMGNLYLIVSICSFFGLFFISPIGQYINRKTHEWQEEGVILNKLFNYNYYILLASILSFFVVMALYSLRIANNIDYIWLIFLVPLFVFFNTWNQTIIPMINMLENRVAFTLFTILTLLLSLIFAYFMIVLHGQYAIIWFSGQIIGLGLVAITAFIYLAKNIKHEFNFKKNHLEITQTNLKKILFFSFPLSLGALFLWIQFQAYRLIIDKYIGSEYLGHLGVGMAIATAISSSFETIVVQFLSPKLYKYMNDETKFDAIFSNITNMIIPIYFLLAVFVSFLAVFLTTILVDTKYASSYTFVIFGIWIEFFRMSSGLLSTVAHAKTQTKLLITPYIIGGIFTIIGIYFISHTQYYLLFIPIILIIGAFLTFLMMYVTMNKLLAIKLKMNNFIRLFPYILGFSITLVLYDYSTNIYPSIIITMLFGIYLLLIINLCLKNYKKEHIDT